MKKQFLKTAVLAIALAGLACATHAQSLFTAISDQSAGLSTKELEKLNMLRQNPTYQSIQMVQVGDIASLETNGFLNVNIPGLATFKAAAFHISHPNDLDGDFTWEGAFYVDSTYDGKDTTEGDGNITLYRKNNEIFGYLRPPFRNEIYELASFGPGKNAIIKYNAEYLSNAREDCGNQEPQNPVERTNSGPCGYIRVLALYTKKASNAVPNITNTILTGMSDLDGATWNSMGSVDQPKFVLANMMQLPDSFIEQSYAYPTLATFSGNPYIQGLRNAYNADIVVFLTDGNFVNPNNNSIIIDGQSNQGLDAEAYAVIEADKCNYQYTFSHEIGHVMGALHNLCDDENTVTCAPVKANLNHPMKIHRFCVFCDNDSKQYQTIMWELNGISRSHYYSTPNRSIFKKPLGDNSYHNNTKVLSDNSCTVSGYRADTAVYFTVGITGTSVAHTGQSVTLIANPTGGTPPYHYVWKMESGLFSYIVLGSTTNTVTFPMPNQVHAFVKVQCYDYYNRSCNADKTVTNWDHLVYQPYTENDQATLPRLFQPAREEDITMNVYPNPASESFTVGLSIPAKDAAQHSLIITDVLGKIVYSVNEIGTELVNITIDGAKFAAGNYIIKLTGGKEPKITKMAITH